MPILIRFGRINANAVEDNGILFNGVNQVFGWNAHLKQTMPLSAAGVLNPHVANINVLLDNDFADQTINEQDVTIGSMFEEHL